MKFLTLRVGYATADISSRVYLSAMNKIPFMDLSTEKVDKMVYSLDWKGIVCQTVKNAFACLSVCLSVYYPF